MSDTSIQENKLQILKLVIESFDGKKKIDVSPWYLGLILNEDIYSYFVTGGIIIAETVGLISSLPIMGEEFVRITFRQEGFEEIHERVYFISSITNRQKEARNVDSYIINFISFEYFSGITNRVSKSFVNKSGKAILESITADIIDKKDFQQDSEVMNLIIPNITVNKAITFILKRSLNSSSIPDFVFYQSIMDNKFNFKSISALKENTENKTLLYIPREDSKPTEENWSYYTVLEEINSDIRDNTSNYVSGTYGQVEHYIESKSKKSVVSLFDMKEKRDNFSRLNNHNTYTDSWAESLTSPLSKYTITTMGQKDNKQSWADKRQMVQSILESHIVTVKTIGYLHYKVGETIYYNRQATNVEMGSDEYSVDKYLTGKYLIAAVKHEITPLTFHTYLRLVKDSNETV